MFYFAKFCSFFQVKTWTGLHKLTILPPLFVQKQKQIEKKSAYKFQGHNKIHGKAFKIIAAAIAA